jgi:hypothetical protein
VARHSLVITTKAAQKRLCVHGRTKDIVTKSSAKDDRRNEISLESSNVSRHPRARTTVTHVVGHEDQHEPEGDKYGRTVNGRAQQPGGLRNDSTDGECVNNVERLHRGVRARAYPVTAFLTSLPLNKPSSSTLASWWLLEPSPIEIPPEPTAFLCSFCAICRSSFFWKTRNHSWKTQIAMMTIQEATNAVLEEMCQLLKTIQVFTMSVFLRLADLVE